MNKYLYLSSVELLELASLVGKAFADLTEDLGSIPKWVQCVKSVSSVPRCKSAGIVLNPTFSFTRMCTGDL